MSSFTKLERQQRDRLNRVEKLAPGNSRVWRLIELADQLRAEAEMLPDLSEETRQALDADALFLDRLAWDLAELRGAARGRPAQHEPPGSRHWTQQRRPRP